MPSEPPGFRAAEFERLRRRLRLAVGALILVTLIGVLGFLLIAGGRHGLIDAIYMTVITLTTVGFGEIIDMSANPAGRVFTVGLLLVGMGIVAYTVPQLAAFVLEGQLHHAFARRRMQKTIDRLDGHFVVCGDGATARYVLDELVHTRRDTVLVTPSEERAQEIVSDSETPVVVGDPTLERHLRAAGATRARGVVFAMENDKDNVLGVLTARQLGPQARIVAATERDETVEKLRAAGADAVVSPSRIGGLRMASELVRPAVVTFLDQMLRDPAVSLRVEEVAVPAASSGRTIGALAVEDIPDTMVLALRQPDGTFRFKPGPDTRLDAGVALVVMADAEGRERLQRRLET